MSNLVPQLPTAAASAGLPRALDTAQRGLTTLVLVFVATARQLVLTLLDLERAVAAAVTFRASRLLDEEAAATAAGPVAQEPADNATVGPAVFVLDNGTDLAATVDTGALVTGTYRLHVHEYTCKKRT